MSDISKRVAFNFLPIDEGIEEQDQDDPRFVEKVRSLKRSLPRLVSKKNKRLSQYGIGTIRGNGKVEDLVDALMMIAFE